MTTPLVYSFILWILAFLFLLRVIGQALVAFLHVPFLPPMPEWYSGLVPYPILLPIQLAIIALLIKICLDFSRARGFFVSLRPITGQRLRWLSYVCATSMVVRYVVTMALFPERRWFSGTIPIVFHFVLAAYIYTVGHYQTRQTEMA